MGQGTGDRERKGLQFKAQEFWFFLNTKESIIFLDQCDVWNRAKLQEDYSGSIYKDLE